RAEHRPLGTVPVAVRAVTERALRLPHDVDDVGLLGARGLPGLTAGALVVARPPLAQIVGLAVASDRGQRGERRGAEQPRAKGRHGATAWQKNDEPTTRKLSARAMGASGISLSEARRGLLTGRHLATARRIASHEGLAADLGDVELG